MHNTTILPGGRAYVGAQTQNTWPLACLFRVSLPTSFTPCFLYTVVTSAVSGTQALCHLPHTHLPGTPQRNLEVMCTKALGKPQSQPYTLQLDWCLASTEAPIMSIFCREGSKTLSTTASRTDTQQKNSTSFPAGTKALLLCPQCSQQASTT